VNHKGTRSGARAAIVLALSLASIPLGFTEEIHAVLDANGQIHFVYSEDHPVSGNHALVSPSNAKSGDVGQSLKKNVGEAKAGRRRTRLDGETRQRRVSSLRRDHCRPSHWERPPLGLPPTEIYRASNGADIPP
jgi:hypothetical protein